MSHHRELHKVTLLLCTSVSNISDVGEGLYPFWHHLMDFPLTAAEVALGGREKEQYTSFFYVLL